MKMLQQARAQLADSAAAMGPLTLVRAAEEHGGPHSAWFWDPTQQGGGVLSDMGCHSIAVGRYLLTPAGRPPRFLEPQTRVGAREPAEVGPAALARRAARAARRRLRAHAGRGLRDRARHLPRSRDRAGDARAVHGVVDVRQAGPAPARRRDRPGLRARGEQPALAARGVHRRRRGRRRSPTPSSRSRRRPRRAACSRSSRTSPTSTATPTRTSTRSPRSAPADRRCSTSTTASTSCGSRWPRTCRPSRGGSSTSPIRRRATRSRRTCR